MRKLTRAERYKRNYRLVKNAYQDTTLAKLAQTWSDDRIYNDLGVKITKSTPKLRKVPKTKKAYYTRKLTKFLYGRSLGFTVVDAKKYTRYQKRKIESSYEYQDASSKKRNLKNKHRRMDLWADWSSHPAGSKTSNFPPEIEKMARDFNRDIKMNDGKKLDDHAHYGYVVAFYMFVEGKTFDEISEFVKQDLNDEYGDLYKITVRAT